MKIKIKSTEEALEVQPKRKPRVIKKDFESHSDSAKRKKSNIHYLVYFVSAVFICILLALLFRVALSVRNSTFSTPSYAVLVTSDPSFLISVDTASKKLAIVEVGPRHSNNRIQKSMLLKTPLDGKMYKKDGVISINDFPSVKFLWATIMRPWEYGFEGMTAFDAFKLTQYALGVQEKDIVRHRISETKDGVFEGLDSQELYDIFKDPIIINEQQSIEVVNGTGEEGLAGQVSLLLKNAGGNVVSVGSSNSVVETTLVASANSHTLERMSHILGVDPTIDENFASISDIKVVLGQNFVKKLK